MRISFVSLLGPAVAVAALFLLPAFRVSLPMLPSAQWTVAGMAAGLVRGADSGASQSGSSQPDLGDILRQARALEQQFGGLGGNGKLNASLDRGFAAAALIPVAALVAGLLAVLSWLWLLLGWRRAAILNALCGVAASLYAIGAGARLTYLARTAAAEAMSNMQTNLSGIMRTLDWAKLGRQLAGNIGLVAEPGLYVLLLAFLAVLIAPAPRKRRAEASDAPVAS